jgi:hypothetical protein
VRRVGFDDRLARRLDLNASRWVDDVAVFVASPGIW